MRDATAAITAAVAAQTKRPVFIVAMETSGGWVRAWNGIGSLLFGGETYLGVGNFGGISPITETSDLRATGVRLTLSGVPSAQIAAAQLVRQGYPCYVWLGFLNSQGQLIADPIQLVNGLTDTVTLEDDPASDKGIMITVSVENEFIDKRRRVYFYTTEDQKLFDSSDVGFDFVPMLQDGRIDW